MAKIFKCFLEGRSDSVIDFHFSERSHKRSTMSNKRIWTPLCHESDDERLSTEDRLKLEGINYQPDDIITNSLAKKPREAHIAGSPATIETTTCGEDSDSDYDDIIDDFPAEPDDMEDFLDEATEDDDDHSTTSTRTTMSTGSVGSNTPSLVGENLESCCLGEGNSEKQNSSNPQQKALVGGPVVKNTEPPLRRSLFSNVPPSLNFVRHNEVVEAQLPTELRKNLRWKLSKITPALVKKVVTNSGFRLMRKNCTEWGGTWGKHMKSHVS